MPALHRPRLVRLSLALACVAAPVALLALPGTADAGTTTASIAATCTAFGQPVTTTFPITTTIEPETVTEGSTVRASLAFSLPFVGPATTLSSFDVDLGLPPQLERVEQVTFAGGNLAPAALISGDGIMISMKGPRAAIDLKLPTVVIEAVVRPGTAGETIVWSAPRALATMLLALGTEATLGCVPLASNPPLATTPIATASTTTTTTVPEPTTTVPEPTTTVPTTAPTTTVVPTTRPPQATNWIVRVLGWLWAIVCWLFGWCR